MLRPDVGTQTQFRRKKGPASYSYDPSLSPTLDWDGQNFGRERAEARIAALQDRIAHLDALLGDAEVSGGRALDDRWTIAVKAVDNRGNELMVITPLPEPEA